LNLHADGSQRGKVSDGGGGCCSADLGNRHRTLLVRSCADRGIYINCYTDLKCKGRSNILIFGKKVFLKCSPKFPFFIRWLIITRHPVYVQINIITETIFQVSFRMTHLTRHTHPSWSIPVFRIKKIIATHKSTI